MKSELNEALNNIGTMTAADLECALQAATIQLQNANISAKYRQDIRALQISYQYQLEKLRVEEFIDFIKDTLPNLKDASEKEWDDFYSTTWTIRFGNKEVQISNEAMTWQSMLDLLETYYKDCL